MSKNMSTGNLLTSKHHTRYQALRELGSNLLNGIKVKLPRDRKFVESADPFQKRRAEFISLSLDKIKFQKKEKEVNE